MTGCDGFSHMVWSVVVFVGLRSPPPSCLCPSTSTVLHPEAELSARPNGDPALKLPTVTQCN
jgi:hypothetical protein